MLRTECSNIGKIRYLSSWIGDCLREHYLSIRTKRFFYVSYFCCVNKADLDTVSLKGLEQASRIPKQILRGHDVITSLKESNDCGADGGHSGPETNGCQPIFHSRDFALQCLNGGVNLPAIGVSGLSTLEDSGKLVGAFVSVSHAGVNRFY